MIFASSEVLMAIYITSTIVKILYKIYEWLIEQMRFTFNRFCSDTFDED